MLKDWAKFYEAITKPLPIASSLFLFVSTSFLLLASDSTLDKLGLSATVTEYRWLVGLFFTVAAAWLLVTSLIWVGQWGYQLWSVRRAEEKQRRRLHALTADERRILSGYVENETRTRVFHDVPDLGAAQGLAEDGILYRPEVAQDGIAVTYNIQEWALAYLSTHRELLAVIVPAATRWSDTSTKSPDWFARGTALLAIILTIIGLYFTHRTYTWQTKTYQESLEEKVLLRAGFKYMIANNRGNVSVDVVNTGIHPVYVESVQIEVPCDPKDFPSPALPVGCDECIKVEQICSLMLYRRDPTRSNKPIKPLESGSEATYTMDWDFAKYPLQEWVKTKKLESELWFDVTTTKKQFRQHPFSTWYQINDAKGVRVYLPNGTQ